MRAEIITGCWFGLRSSFDRKGFLLRVNALARFQRGTGPASGQGGGGLFGGLEGREVPHAGEEREHDLVANMRPLQFRGDTAQVFDGAAPPLEP